MTNRQAKKMIRAAERGYKGINCTRWYSTVHPKRNGEARIRTWAVKTWQGKPLIMLAAEYHTDGKQPHVSGRCLVSNATHTKAFNWLDYGGRSHVAVWSDVDAGRDDWLEAYDHQFMRGNEFYGDFLNGLEDTKYRYCGWEHSGMRLTDYLDVWRISPMAELLSKAGLRRWLRPAHIRALAASKPLARFVASRRDSLAHLPPSIVRREFGRVGAAADLERMEAEALLRPFGLTSLPIDARRVYRWLTANSVDPRQLVAHIENLKELKMSLAYEPHVLPHDWATYHLAVADRVREVREEAEEREREIVRMARRDARRLIQKWIAEGKVRKGYSVTIPQSETEFVNEGEAMNNCVGGYWWSYKSGEANLIFVRKGGKPYMDIEVGEDGSVEQMRYNHNRAVSSRSYDGRLCKMLASAYAKRKAA